jgi:hypothetical protein
MMVLRGDELSSTSGLTLDFGGRNTEEKYVLKSSAFAAAVLAVIPLYVILGLWFSRW